MQVRIRSFLARLPTSLRRSIAFRLVPWRGSSRTAGRPLHEGEMLESAGFTQTTEGLRAAVQIRQQWPGTAVVVLSQHVETGHLSELLADGSARDRLPAQGSASPT